MRKLLIFFLFIFTLPLILGAPIQPNQTSFNINLTKGISKIIYVNINNTNNYELYDVRAEGDIVVSSSSINKLEGGENVSFSITINSNEKGEVDKIIKIIGFTRLNCSAIETQTHKINITEVGAHPRDVEICKNDNIEYNNNYGSSVYLDIDSLDIYQGIGNGNSYVQNFPNLGQVIYRIEPLIDLGYITVTDEFSNIHSDEDDGSISLHVITKLEETNISIDFNKINFNMEYNDLKSGYVIITNIGEKKAEGINLIGDWITFDKNNFDLNIDEDKAVNFVISPTITDTSDTDKYYNKTIYISGDNIDTREQILNIYIQYSDVAAGNLSSPEWWIKRKAFCDAYPTSPDCLTEPYILYRDKLIYDAPPILMNMSPQDVKDYLDEINGLRNDWLNYDNQRKQDDEAIKTSTTQTAISNNETLSAVLDIKKDFSSFKSVSQIIFGTLLFLFMGVIASFVLYKYYIKNVKSKESIV